MLCYHGGYVELVEVSCEYNVLLLFLDRCVKCTEVRNRADCHSKCQLMVYGERGELFHELHEGDEGFTWFLHYWT